MSLRFTYVCDLLEDLAHNGAKKTEFRSQEYLIAKWFQNHASQTRRDNFNVAVLLSLLIPVKRSDRVYNIQMNGLRGIFARAQGLGHGRLKELDSLLEAGSNRDLGDAIESMLKACPGIVDEKVTIEDVDNSLTAVASGCRFSSAAIKASTLGDKNPHIQLGGLYKRLSPRDAKWLTRLVLKNYSPVSIDPWAVYQCCHPILPCLLRVHDDFVYAGAVIQEYRRSARVADGSLDRENLKNFLVPALGIKVGRQTWLKGRKLRDCISMGHGLMSCEEKLDGEYCQIHIDLSKGRNYIRIFSKSGKDSTQDRQGLHEAIRRALQIGQPGCLIRKGCILEGELVVYSDKEKRVLGFDKIRKYVTRSGSFLGLNADSQRHHSEHLMIVFYDILMIDDESLLSVKHSLRFTHLERIISTIPGQSALVRRRVINFNRPSAASELQLALDQCIAERGEGLVLKANDPYFNFSTSRTKFECCPIKLKKQYLEGIGEVGDFAVVGARYDASKAKTYNIPHLKYTHFYLACLANKYDVQNHNQRPQYKVTNVVEINQTQMRELVKQVNPETIRVSTKGQIPFDIARGIDNDNQPTILFPEPPIFDIQSMGFDRPPNTGFLCPRFPSVTKIHVSRTWRDIMSFEELQEVAKEEMEAPASTSIGEPLVAAPLALNPPQGVWYHSQQSEGSLMTTPARSSGSSQPHQISLTPTIPLSAVDDSSSTRHGDQVARRDDVSFDTPRAVSSNAQPSASPTENLSGQKRQRAVTEGSERKTKMPKLADNLSQSSDDENSGTTRRKQQPRREALRDVTSPANSQGNVISVSTSMSKGKGLQLSGTQTSNSATRVSFSTRMESHVLSSTKGGSTPASNITAASAKRKAAGAKAQADSSGQTNRGSCAGHCNSWRYPFLLAPCVASIPWLTEDLLRYHGVHNYITDPNEWKTSPGNDSTASIGTPSPSQQVRTKKVALVEPRRKEATQEFLRQIEATDLRRKNGKKEHVVVFDWRVMEAINKEEATSQQTRRVQKGIFDMNRSDSIWRKYWVGLV